MKTSGNKYRPRRRTGKRKNGKLLSSSSFMTTMVVAALVLFACTHIWQNVYILNLSSEVGALKKEKNQIKDIIKKNQVEINDLCRHSRIEQLALEKFKLRQTASENMFTLVSKRKFSETYRFADLMSSFQKVADHFPVITESKAESKEIFDFDEE
ncbi:MAG: hypothetical protein GY865_09040 [candidate division Zixibacteria bacterium]|nr:hypothetical protein [candidate division Zixibacteria bacterium]